MVNHRCLCVFVSAVVAASALAADEPESRSDVTPGTTKSVASAKTAIKAVVPDPTGETYGVVGISNSLDGAGLAAANTNGGPDLVLDGGEDGEPDAIISQAGIDRSSGTTQTFTLHNSGAGRLDLYVDGILFGDGAGLTGVNASLLDGHTPGEFALDVDLATSGSSSVHWDNLTNEPTGLADGDDDTLGALECGEAQIAKWNGSSWNCAGDVGVEYKRTRIVGPVGSPPENGATLLDALASIPTPTSREEGWLLKIEPGVYDVGTTPFEMKSWVDVEGSGQDVTLIRGAVCETGWTYTTGVVEGAESAELRSLSVENTCSGTTLSSTAVYNGADNARFNHVTASVFGAAEYNAAIFNEGFNVVFDFVTAEAGGATGTNRGLTDGGGGARITNSRISALAGGSTSLALEFWGAPAEVSDVVVIARNATTSTRGVWSVPGVAFTNLTVTASSTHGGEQTGILADGGIRVANSLVAAEDAVVLTDLLTSDVVFVGSTLNGSRYGLDADSYLTSVNVYVNNCSIRGPTSSVRIDDLDVFVGGSQLSGGTVSILGSGNAVCAGVWDEAYTFYQSSCP